MVARKSAVWLETSPYRPGAKALAPKTVLEIHRIIRVATIAQAPRLRSIPKHDPQAWTADQLTVFLQAVVGHRLFPAFWINAKTGMRRSELLGLRWPDVDKATVSIIRGLVAVWYGL